jgi:hypothetical protein
MTSIDSRRFWHGREGTSRSFPGILATLIIVLLVPIATGSSSADGLALGTDPDDQDIREIFLSVPVPKSYLDEFAELLGDRAQRTALLDKTDFGADKNVLDIPNGYLRFDTEFHTKQGNTSEIRTVVTYFARQNGNRLVVIQTTDLYNYPDPVVVNGFYLLANGKYTAQEASQYLPPISFFSDFWGNQPLPDKNVVQYVRVHGDDSFYTIEWPRKGTVARAKSFVPYSDTDTEEQRRIDRTLGKYQFKDLALIWDKDKGVFVKGTKARKR